jgi:MFS family permease
MEAATADFKEKRWLALILLCSAQFVVVLDASIVNVALPTIGKALNFSQENLPWVVNAYVLTFGGFLLLGGRTADLLGRRRVFMAGLLLVAVASLAAGFAATEGQLIAARAAQGLGAAIISPAALSIVTTTFSDGSERNKALGVWGAVAGSGGAAGVLLGGILTDGLGWEWVLWVNVPVSLIAFALSPRLLAETRAESQTRAFDVGGAVTVTAGLSVLVYALVDANNAGWGSTQTIGLIALSALLLAAFVAIELRAAKPLVPFSIFRIRTLTGANVVGLLVGASLFSMFFFISLYMQQVLGYSAIHAGLSYLPFGPGDHGLGGHRLPARHQARLQAGARRGPALHRHRPRLVQPGLGRRQLHRRHPRPLAVRGGRPRLRLRDDDDRRCLGRRGERGRARQRADQHLAADRRSPRPRRALGSCDLRHQRRGILRIESPRRPDRRVSVRLPRRRPDRPARLRAHSGPDPRQRQPRARRTRQRSGD